MALEASRTALALYEAKLGLDHVRTLGCINTLAANYLIVGRDADAIRLLDECLKRVEGKVVDPEVISQLMAVRLRYFVKTRDSAGCRATTETWEKATAEMWEKQKRTDSEGLYEAACMRAVTAGVILASDKSATAAQDAAAEAEQAMAWLRQAVAAGYKDGEHLKNDKDLDALRDREDFKALMAELEEGQQSTDVK